MSAVVELTKQLIACPSVTPEDAGCQAILIHRLKQLGFTINEMPIENINNVWARLGDEAPLFVFAGHTDVVPPGPESLWDSPPFEPIEEDGQLFGRGAADMKGSLAAMIISCEEFLKTHPSFKGSIAFLITGDEEGPATFGTHAVLKQLSEKDKQIDYCIVGEPTCENTFGDTVKIGRRGSLSGRLIIEGKQGHIAYPHLADNPIHHLFAPLQEMLKYEWCKGNDDFQATSFQVSNIHGGTGAGNVTPNTVSIDFNFRYSPETSDEQIQKHFKEILNKHCIQCELIWEHSAKPFRTQSGKLIEAILTAITEETQQTCTPSTSGGTSDARFLVNHANEILEFGPCNRNIHQINESVGTKELEQLSKVYQQVLQILLT